MKKTLSILLLLVSIALVRPVATNAHILKTSGTIGVVFHLEPDHNPIVGEPAHISFDIKDRANAISVTNCDCRIEISLGNDLIHTQQLFTNPSQDTLANQMFNFAFPQKGVYKLVFSGEPKQGASFNKFQIEFDQRVDKGQEVSISDPIDHNANTQTHTTSSVEQPVLFLIIGILVLVVLLVFIGRSRKWFILLLIINVGLLHMMPVRYSCIHESHCETHSHQYECCMPVVLDLNPVVSFQQPRPVNYKLAINIKQVEYPHFSSSISPRAPPSIFIS